MGACTGRNSISLMSKPYDNEEFKCGRVIREARIQRAMIMEGPAVNAIDAKVTTDCVGSS